MSVTAGEKRLAATYLSAFMVNHDIVWFDVAMHDVFAVCIVESGQQLEHVETDVDVFEGGIQIPVVLIVHVLCHDRWRLAHVVTGDVNQADDIGTTDKVLENFDLELHQVLLGRLQHFDDAFLTIAEIDSSEYFGIFTLAYNFG